MTFTLGLVMLDDGFSCEGLMRMRNLVFKELYLSSENGQLPYTAVALFDTNQ